MEPYAFELVNQGVMTQFMEHRNDSTYLSKLIFSPILYHEHTELISELRFLGA